MHNVITNSITEMNNLRYTGEYVVAENLWKMKSEKNLSGKGEFRQRLRSGEKMSVE